LRAKIEGLTIRYGDGQLPPVTVSGGVAAWPDAGANLMELLRVADDALYRAKQNGRNRVELPGETAHGQACEAVTDAAVTALGEMLEEAGEGRPAAKAGRKTRAA